MKMKVSRSTEVASPSATERVMRLAGDDISRKVDYARQVLKDLPSVWWVGPDSHREAIQTLTAMGGLIRGKVPVMVARPSDLASDPLPAGISIEVIEDDRELLTWVECFAPSMGVSEGSLAQLQRVEMEGRTSKANTRGLRPS